MKLPMPWKADGELSSKNSVELSNETKNAKKHRICKRPEGTHPLAGY